MELTEKEIRIGEDIQISDDGQEICAYLETWFDVDEKFRIHTSSDDGTGLNLYGFYNPFTDALRLECEISSDDAEECFCYAPTASEEELIKRLIEEKIRMDFDQTPQEFCAPHLDEDFQMGGMI